MPGRALESPHLEEEGTMAVVRISIHNFLRAGEIFLQEHDNYSESEQALLRAMLSRLSAKVNKSKDTEAA
jgi:hypothetical protein